MNAVLKVKSKALEQESKMLRDQIIKHGQAISWKSFKQQSTEEVIESLGDLQSYRAHVRDEARVLFLARALLRGKPRSTVEHKEPPFYIQNRVWGYLPVGEYNVNAWAKGEAQ